MKSKRFHVSSEKHVLHMLTNLYSHPYTSVAREYIANAMDAQGDKPVTIRYNEFGNQTAFVDYGEGMTADEALDLFSGFGNTTKQGSTSTAGEFGVGAKSALAIVDEFGVVTTKDGITSELKIEKSDGTATVTVVAESPTDKPSGTTVLIPDPSRMLFKKAESYAKFLDPSKVEAGEWEDFEWTDRIKHVPTGGLGLGGSATDTVFIYRGLAYRSDYKASNTPWISGRKPIILLDDDTNIKVAPNRESFVSGGSTNRILSAADDLVAEDARAYLLDHLSELDPYDAAQRIIDDKVLAQTFKCLKYREKFYVKGTEIKPYSGMIKEGTFVEISKGGKLTSVERTRMRVGHEVILVTGFNGLSGQYKKSSLRTYCNKKGIDGRFCFAESPVDGTVVTGTISKSKINKHKPSASSGSAKPRILDGKDNPTLVVGSKSESAPAYDWLDAMGVDRGVMHGNRIDKYCREQDEYDHVFTEPDFRKFVKLDTLIKATNWLAFVDSMDSFEFVANNVRSKYDKPLESNLIRFGMSGEKGDFYSTDPDRLDWPELEAGQARRFREGFEIYKIAKRENLTKILEATHNVFTSVMETIKSSLEHRQARTYNQLTTVDLSLPGAVLFDKTTDANEFVYSLNRENTCRIAGLIYFHPSIDNQTTLLPDMLCAERTH